MKAMLLAAGYGKRMQPLTLTTPKPLLLAGGKPLIVHHLEHLSAVGIGEVIINVAHLGVQIKDALGNGSQWGLTIRYSEEPEPLESAGAILQALPLLGDDPFILINADIWTDYQLSTLVHHKLPPYQGHLVLTRNPEHNPNGDFCVTDGELSRNNDGNPSYTFTGISKLSPRLISEYPKKRPVFPLAEVFCYAIEKQLLSAQVMEDNWRDVGTPERLHSLDQWLKGGAIDSLD